MGKRTPEETSPANAVVFANFARAHARLGLPSAAVPLGKAIGVGEGSAKRLLDGRGNLTIYTLEKIAAKLDVEVWELLVPGFDPRKRARIVTEEEFDAAVMERLAALMQLNKTLGAKNDEEGAAGPGVAQPFGHRAHDALRKIDFPDKHPPADAGTKPAGKASRKTAATAKK